MIHCEEHKMEYASNGKANAGLALGIIGTSLAGLLWANGAGKGNGLNIFGNGNAVDELQAQVAELRAMRYTDQIGIDLYKNIIAQSNAADAKISANMKEVMGYVVELSKEVALNKQSAYYEGIITNNKIDCCCEKVNTAIDYNRQLNELADASILSYVNSTFLPGQLRLPITSICPQPLTSTTTSGN